MKKSLSLLIVLIVTNIIFFGSNIFVYACPGISCGEYDPGPPITLLIIIISLISILYIIFIRGMVNIIVAKENKKKRKKGRSKITVLLFIIIPLSILLSPILFS